MLLRLERRQKWDRRYLELAKFYSSFSKDPSTKVGACIVDYNNSVVGQGFNGFPKGVVDGLGRYEDRETKYKYVVHAELNAILNAGHQTRGSTLYVFPSFGFPPVCTECCKATIQSGIIRIVGYKPLPADLERAKRWQESINISRQMCQEADVIMDEIEQE